jgi:hypothetical protein
MEPRTAWILRIAFAGALSVVATGCPNPNTYTTPRTIGSGNISHSLAAEAWGFSVADSTGTTTTTTTRTIPTFPTYTLRIGAGDGCDALRAPRRTSARRARFFIFAGDRGVSSWHTWRVPLNRNVIKGGSDQPMIRGRARA